VLHVEFVDSSAIGATEGNYAIPVSVHDGDAAGVVVASTFQNGPAVATGALGYAHAHSSEVMGADPTAAGVCCNFAIASLKIAATSSDRSRASFVASRIAG
jgi:phage gp37-like protein